MALTLEENIQVTVDIDGQQFLTGNSLHYYVDKEEVVILLKSDDGNKEVKVLIKKAP